jgi:hypothetical protein
MSTIRGADAAANSGAAASKQVSVVAGRLYSVSAYNGSGGNLFLQVHDKASVPADTSVPLLVQPVPNGTNGYFEFTNGRPFSNGIYVCFSTTDVTKTLSGSTSVILDVAFRNDP